MSQRGHAVTRLSITEVRKKEVHGPSSHPHGIVQVSSTPVASCVALHSRCISRNPTEKPFQTTFKCSVFPSRLSKINPDTIWMCQKTVETWHWRRFEIWFPSDFYRCISVCTVWILDLISKSFASLIMQHIMTTSDPNRQSEQNPCCYKQSATRANSFFRVMKSYHGGFLHHNFAALLSGGRDDWPPFGKPRQQRCSAYIDSTAKE